MGGGGSTEIEETEESKAQLEISQELWGRYQEQGIPVENEYIHHLTGQRINEDGEYEATTYGRVNADGTTRVDTTSSDVATEKAFGSQLHKVDPNRLNRINSIGQESADIGVDVGVESGLSQQTNTMQGIVNAAGMGKGREMEGLRSSIDLAFSAENDAAQAAQESFNRQGARQYVAGQVIGAPVGYATTRRKAEEASK